MRERGWRAETCVFGIARVGSWRSRTAGLQELADVFAEFLAGGEPVRANVVAELGECALEVQLVLLEPGDVEFLSAGATLELTRDVFVVVAYDSGIVSI